LPEAGRKEIKRRIDRMMSLEMPQMEIPGKAIKMPYDRFDAAGFGPLPGQGALCREV
jgi:hypothetical protein